jgi:hypothetical protein
MRRAPSTAIFTTSETIGRLVAVVGLSADDLAASLSSGAADLSRLRTCHHCRIGLSPHAELFLVGDAVFCSTAHRASAVLLERDVAAGYLEPHSLVGHTRRAPTATGVGLAASHRSWCMEDPDRSSSGSERSSVKSTSGFLVQRNAPMATLSC